MKRLLFAACSSLFLPALQAQVPVWTRQVPQAATVWRDVHMLSAMDGWIAGSGGRLRHTTNGGVSWIDVQLPAQDLRDVAFRGPLTGWTAGDGFYRTTDAGVGWSVQPTAVPINALYFLDSARGWLGASNGQVCHTTDGGQTFSPCVQLPGAPQVLALHFVDASTGWAACAGGALLRTDDAGQTWTPQASGTSADLTALEFADASQGWVAAGDRLLHTIDGGASWQAQPLPPDLQARDLDLLGSGFLWVCGSAGRIVHSLDGGATWSPQLAAGGGRLLAIGMGDLFHGLAVGEGGAIWRTSDGSTWQQLEGGAASQPPLVFGVAAVDAQTAWATTMEGELLRTTDGGAHWQASPAGANTIFRAVDFADAQNGYACGEKQAFFPTVAWTHDGGLNWSVFNFTMMVQFHDVAALDAQTALVVGETFVWRTTNGGLSWPSVTPLPYATFHSVDFVDASNGWIVGTGFFRSSDGGASWTHQLSPNETYYGVSFADTSTGWAVGEEGAILKTVNGGMSWTPQSAGTGVPTLRAVQALDTQRLWISGEGGFLAYSANGGQTWMRQVLPTPGVGPTVWSLAFVSAMEGWIGTGEGIWHLGSGPAPCEVQSYCTAKTNSLGLQAALGATGAPSVSVSSFTVTLSGGIPGALGVLFMGASGAADLPFQGGLLCVAPPLVRLPPIVLDPSGAAAIPLDLTAFQPGETRWLQCWYRDPALLEGIALSDGLLVRLCN